MRVGSQIISRAGPCTAGAYREPRHPAPHWKNASGPTWQTKISPKSYPRPPPTLWSDSHHRTVNLFVKLRQKRRSPGVYLERRLEVRRSPHQSFIQFGAIYRQIWQWRMSRAGGALRVGWETKPTTPARHSGGVPCSRSPGPSVCSARLAISGIAHPSRPRAPQIRSDGVDPPERTAPVGDDVDEATVPPFPPSTRSFADEMRELHLGP
jgi:hypothetical protein